MSSISEQFKLTPCSESALFQRRALSRLEVQEKGVQTVSSKRFSEEKSAEFSGTTKDPKFSIERRSSGSKEDERILISSAEESEDESSSYKKKELSTSSDAATDSVTDATVILVSESNRRLTSKKKRVKVDVWNKDEVEWVRKECERYPKDQVNYPAVQEQFKLKFDGRRVPTVKQIKTELCWNRLVWKTEEKDMFKEYVSKYGFADGNLDYKKIKSELVKKYPRLDKITHMQVYHAAYQIRKNMGVSKQLEEVTQELPFKRFRTAEEVVEELGGSEMDANTIEVIMQLLNETDADLPSSSSDLSCSAEDLVLELKAITEKMKKGGSTDERSKLFLDKML